MSVSLKMDKIEYRAVIKYFVKEGLTPNEIHPKFIKVYGDSSPSFSTNKKWVAGFKRGRTGLEDDAREGRPESVTTPEIIEQVHDMLLVDRQMKVREIAETTGFTITNQNPNSSENSGQKPVVQCQRRQGRFRQQERSWHQCFGMLKAFCLLIILKRVKQ